MDGWIDRIIHNKAKYYSVHCYQQHRHCSICCNRKQGTLLAMSHRSNLIVFHILPHYTDSWSSHVSSGDNVSQSVMSQISSRPASVSLATPALKQSRLIIWSRIIPKQEQKKKAVISVYCFHSRLCKPSADTRCLSVKLFCWQGKSQSLANRICVFFSFVRDATMI